MNMKYISKFPKILNYSFDSQTKTFTVMPLRQQLQTHVNNMDFTSIKRGNKHTFISHPCCICDQTVAVS